ncbi:hypothetical protein CRYUN_Cryun14cG0060800 [Craigia yunnanensis]
MASRKIIKDLINADHVDEVCLVDKATTTAAIVLQQIGPVSPKESSRKMTLFYCSTKVRLAIIDHITSMPSVVIPVKELVRICSAEGIDQVFVDVAHAIGSVKVDVKKVGADFYVSNLHKWFFCPPSIAFLYCKKSKISSDVHHPVVSHEFGNGLPIESAWIGTRDYSSQFVVPAVLEFVNRFEGGIDGIMKRNHDEVVKMGKMLAESWGTNLRSPPEMCAGMIMVSKDGEEGVGDNDEFITGYVRISRQVYNTLVDYEKLRDAINRVFC